MNLLGILLQSFFDHQAREQGDKLREAGMRAAVTGRKLAIAGAFFSVATVFFLAAAIVFAIEMGLQFDRASGISFSGLMISATLLIGFSMVSALIGMLIAQKTSEHKVDPQPAPPPRSELRDVLEEIALGLLKEFARSQQRATSDSEKSRSI
jgi:hypothetical protein